MKSEQDPAWEREIEEKAETREQNAKEQGTGAYSKEAVILRKTQENEVRAFARRNQPDEMNTEEKLSPGERLNKIILELIKYQNVTVATENETESEVREEELKHGWALQGVQNLILETTPIDLTLEHELGNPDFRIVVVASRALVFKKQNAWKPEANPGF